MLEARSVRLSEQATESLVDGAYLLQAGKENELLPKCETATPDLSVGTLARKDCWGVCT
jgi:hypothetical protein